MVAEWLNASDMISIGISSMLYILCIRQEIDTVAVNSANLSMFSVEGIKI